MEGKLKDIVALGVPDGPEGGKGRLGWGGTAKGFAWPHTLPSTGPYWAGGADGGDALQALKHVGFVGMCPWEMPLIRSPNLR